VRAYLQTADAVVMPFRDGASYRRSSLTSAIDCGAAIVTTTPAVKTPTFRNGKNLLLIPPGDSPALTAALARLYNNPSLQGTLRAGAITLSREFSWPRIVAAYEAFYRRLVEESV
jgi:glycosyltransferase involved in cell wall biosynthesis